MKTTFIKLDRAIQKNWLWEDKPFSKGQAWVDLLLRANYTDRKVSNGNTVMEYKRGDVNISLSRLAEAWGWSRKKVGTFMEQLQNDQMVNLRTFKGAFGGTVITIENYALYQSDYTPQEQFKEQLRNNCGTFAEHLRNINNKEKKDKKEKNVYYNAHAHARVVGGWTDDEIRQIIQEQKKNDQEPLVLCSPRYQHRLDEMRARINKVNAEYGTKKGAEK